MKPLFIFAAFISTTALAQGDPGRGEKKFEECAACHSLTSSSENVGPSLKGIFGRGAGELTDFRYSPALKRSGIRWSAQTLEVFLADPQKMVPANRMPYAGMPEARDRADLIAYLLQASR